MAKGSQLAQLKAALNQAGVTGQNHGKKRKRAAPVEKDKEKKAAKLQEIHQRLNPFDVKVTKLKHDVGGRRLKGITGKPSQSKQAGIEQRKKTLLKEWEEKDRAGGIVDRRFGENDPMMSLEERMLERFTRERQRASKNTAFNLEDDDDLTHYGQSLSKLDDFDKVGLGMESEEEETSGQIARDIVSKRHFGGFGDEEEEEGEDEEGPARKKTKAEVMAEVIAKSKEHKLLRQMERDQEDNVRHELDNQFATLRELIYAPDPSTSGSNAIPLGVRARSPKSVTETDTVASKLVSGDDYDQHVRVLAFDQRAKPKDRTKTEEELALEAKEALEKAERRRRRRMLGLDESEDEEEVGARKGKRKRGGDDLDDDFSEYPEDFNELGAGLEARGNLSKEEEDGEQESSEEDTSGDDGVSEEFDESEEGEEGEHDQLVALSVLSKSKSKGKKCAKQELPFIFPCPANHGEFLDIIEDVDEEDVPTVVQRIRALYHTSLAADNKFKLQTLATVLIDHVLYAASPPTPDLGLITALFPQLLALTKAYPIPIAQHFNAKLNLMHKNLKRGLSRGSLDQEARTWPGIAELSLLRTIGLIWPTSDLNHSVVSPTRVLLAAYLGLGRVRSLRDIASGLFLCTLFLQFELLSKRLVPEAINFLVNAILHLAPHKYDEVSSLPGSFPSPDFRSEACQPLSMNTKAKKNLIVQKAKLMELIGADNTNEQAKADLLSLAFDLLGQFSDLYKGIEGFIELYEPILEILEHIESKHLFDGHKTQLSRLNDSLRRLLKFSHQARTPLRLQAHKPIPIPTYIPKFETTTSNYLRRQDPDHEKNQAAKLRNQYKQEKKGAIRELRKDARFLASVEQKRQIDKDKAYNERMRRVFGSIEGERAEEKAMEREKAKEKRRAGKK
ncbi:nucleolar protein 14 [Gymnopilus junonius]|uniref:Nucleolar protein 14 n=1 Tax=Gymnopilus junonius TaxID=109634 RepID=A0A9P5P246_GYMJU|nr:nucleolar protein 14 [Gymnopilus junonius]